ncbi:MAG TPA: hypothetical protein VJX67_12610, partial [Blastocatellia bacterium]|nr:hypothetical protein [Blastocatellia bacterium]
RINRSLEIDLPLRTIVDSCDISGLCVAVVNHQMQRLKTSLVERMVARIEGLSEEAALSELNSKAGSIQYRHE